MAEQIYPENRAKDVNGVPVPTNGQIEAEAILSARIAREEALNRHRGARDIER